MEAGRWVLTHPGSPTTKQLRDHTRVISLPQGRLCGTPGSIHKESVKPQEKLAYEPHCVGTCPGLG